MQYDKTPKDNFHAFLVNGAKFAGKYEIPIIATSKLVPNRVITFSKAMKTNDFDQWVLFYEDDYKFQSLWNNTKNLKRNYLEKLQCFRGVISPDFSIYRNMPLAMQIWQTYRNRALAYWMHSNGIEVIPNIRFADERTYDFCFDGVEKNSTVSIGTHGCINTAENRYFFKQGLYVMIEQLSPKIIVIYGTAPRAIFGICDKKGIRTIQFDSEISRARKGAIISFDKNKIKGI